MHPTVRRFLPYVTFVVGISALTFQMTVLYPWHHQLERDFKHLEEVQRRTEEEHFEKKMARISKLEGRLESIMDLLEEKEGKRRADCLVWHDISMKQVYDFYDQQTPEEGL
ncbi:hypothetical protein HDU99_007130, partial [Rhizoclosmatium hyalinum]